MSAVGICDFCSAPHPTWVYPADNFAMQRFGWGSDGGWAACDECSDLIEKKQDDAVINTRMPRVMTAALLKAGMPSLGRAELQIIEQETAKLYKRFKKARSGPRRLIEAA